MYSTSRCAVPSPRERCVIIKTRDKDGGGGGGDESFSRYIVRTPYGSRDVRVVVCDQIFFRKKKFFREKKRNFTRFL